MPLEYKNLDATRAYAGLRKIDGKAIDLKGLLTPERIAAYSIPAGGGLTYNYAAKKVTDEVLDGLQRLSDEQQLIGKYEFLYNGGIANRGEKRMVLHHLVRGQLGKAVVHEGKDLGAFYAEQQKKIADFCAEVQGQDQGLHGQGVQDRGADRHRRLGPRAQGACTWPSSSTPEQREAS